MKKKKLNIKAILIGMNIMPCKHKNYSVFENQGDGYGQAIITGKKCILCGIEFDIKKYSSNGQTIKRMVKK